MKIEDLPYAQSVMSGIKDVVSGGVVPVVGVSPLVVPDRQYFASKTAMSAVSSDSFSMEFLRWVCNFIPSDESFLELEVNTEYEAHLALIGISACAGLYLFDRKKNTLYLTAILPVVMLPCRVTSKGHSVINDWMPFDYKKFEKGVFWVAAIGQECDEEGELVPSGKTVSKVVLVKIGIQTDGQPFFDSIDPTNFGYVEFEDLVTHYRPVTPPDAPN